MEYTKEQLETWLEENGLLEFATYCERDGFPQIHEQYDVALEEDGDTILQFTDYGDDGTFTLELA